MKDVFVVAAKRTPFGTYGGKLANLSTIELTEVAGKAAMAAGGVKPEMINSIIMGNIFHVRLKYISHHQLGPLCHSVFSPSASQLSYQK